MNKKLIIMFSLLVVGSATQIEGTDKDKCSPYIQGSYINTCSDCKCKNGVMTCNCQKPETKKQSAKRVGNIASNDFGYFFVETKNERRQHDMVKSSIHLSEAPIKNVKGILKHDPSYWVQCGLVHGDYKNSTHSCHCHENTISCICNNNNRRSEVDYGPNHGRFGGGRGGVRNINGKLGIDKNYKNKRN